MRVPAAGRDVRELAAALGGAPGLAAGGPGRLLRRLADGVRQQRLRPGRPCDADRPGGQERHPDRGVRQGEVRGGRFPRGIRPGIGPPALPADPDDGVRVHPGRRAAHARERRRRGGAERHGHLGVLGHADRDGAGRLHHSRKLHVLRRIRPPRAACGGGRGGSCPSRGRAHAGGRVALMRRSLGGLVTALVLSGRAVGPDYHRPEIAIPSAFRGATPEAPQDARSFGDEEWWKVFQDEQPPNPGPDRPRAELRPAGRRGAHPPGPVPGRDRAVVPVPHGRCRRGRPLRPADWGKQVTQFRDLLAQGGASVAWEWTCGATSSALPRRPGPICLPRRISGRTVVLTLISDVARAYFTLRELDLEMEISRQHPDHPGGLPQAHESPRAGRSGDDAGRAPGRATVLHRGGHHRGRGAEHRAAGEPDQYPRRELPRGHPQGGVLSRSRLGHWPRPCRRA